MHPSPFPRCAESHAGAAADQSRSCLPFITIHNRCLFLNLLVRLVHMLLAQRVKDCGTEERFPSTQNMLRGLGKPISGACWKEMVLGVGSE